MVTVSTGFPGADSGPETISTARRCSAWLPTSAVLTFGSVLQWAARITQPLNVHCVRRYPVRAHESIAHAAHHYRSATPGVPAALNRAAVAVAGRVEEDRVQLTNSAWSFSARALSESQRFDDLQVVNDFEAVGHAVGALRGADLNPVGSQRISLPMTQGVCAIVGVGTGLGVGGVIANAGRFSVLATEGGHASFAPDQ